MNVVVPLFLLAPLVLVPLGYRLLEVAAPGSRPPTLVLRLVVPAVGVLVVAFWVPAGPVAAALTVPWVAVTGATAAIAGLRWLRDPARFHPEIRHATDAAVAFLSVGAVFAFMDRLGAQPLGFATSIILLTAVHFHFAGFVLPLAGALAYSRRPSRWLEVAIGTVVVGIPITALGFLGIPLANWVGAVLTAVGGFGIGFATLIVARTLAGRAATALAAIAGASLLLSMPLAVIYATGTLTGAAWLGMDVMARVHGGLNAIGFALPAMVAWTLDRRVRDPKQAAPPAGPARDPRFLALGATAIILGYAIVIAFVTANARDGEVEPPATVPPFTLVLLLMLPGVIAAIGALRRSRPVLTAAGVLCLAQAFIAFSGATIPFLLPAILLLVLGANKGGEPIPRRAVAGAVAIVALGIGSWFALLGLTETVCWIARPDSVGTLVYARIPVSDTLTLQIGDVAAGCDGGVSTMQGLAIASIFGIGAIALAVLSSRTPDPPTSSGGPAGPIDVMRFNAVPFVLGPLVAVAAGVLAALTSLPDAIRIVFALVALAAAAITASAILAVVWVFRIGAERRWRWVATAAGQPHRWINLTTGFDDSTATLRGLLPTADWDAIDVFDPTIDHEAALLTARRRFSPSARACPPTDLGLALEVGAYDAAFLLMSVHEAHGRDRVALFAAVARALSPTGRLILVEHLRDGQNRIAFGPGANHFQTRATWLAVAGDAGLTLSDEARLTPYVRGLVFVRAPR